MGRRRVLLIVGGGVAAYKALELVRLLRGDSMEVCPVLTDAGARFVTPLSLAALAQAEVRSDLFALSDEAAMGHIELSRAADLLVVAPATADLIGKAAHGLADDLASALLLATDKRVLWAPAMNVRMWEHPATQRNCDQLRKDGAMFVGPTEGEMACGETGFGRMAEPAEIAQAVRALLGRHGSPLIGRRALVTAGPTAEPVDPVRVLTNLSSGRQGYAIADCLHELGARVTLVSGPTHLPSPPGAQRVNVRDARQMLAACEAALPVDIAVLVAAVTDWRVTHPSSSKIKRSAGVKPSISLTENPDILAAIATPGPNRPKLVIGFAAETENLEINGREKLLRKQCDWIVANDVRNGGVFGEDENEVMLLTREGKEVWPRSSKIEVARRLADRIAEALREV